ncbi:MAG TPA: ATP-grasp domain-containing protein, partial [Gammaproteobacteria bacterium]|nr:ATP-grasp domain-containing protein [Gammaproteobacteria bacterium]
LYILPWHFLHRGKTSDFEHRLPSEARTIVWDELPELIDFAYIALHGRFGEDGILQGALELLSIPYLGSSIYTSALCMDKQKTNLMLRANGIATPRGIVIEEGEIIAQKSIAVILAELSAQQISAPWVIKPHKEGSSLGVTIAGTPDELAAAIFKAAYVHPTTAQSVLVEECITGMEFSCIVLEDYKKGSYLPLPPTEVVPEKGSALFDYEQKYMPGRAMKYTPARCSQEVLAAIQATCVRVMELFDIATIGRIDGFVDTNGNIIIVDPNTFSGMAPSSFLFREAAEIGMSHCQLINHLIETDLARYGILSTIEQQEEKERTMMEQTDKKLRVGVLMGGATHEREISLESGRNVTYK